MSNKKPQQQVTEFTNEKVQDFYTTQAKRLDDQHKMVMASLDLVGDIHAQVSVIQKELYKINELTAKYMHLLQGKK